MSLNLSSDSNTNKTLFVIDVMAMAFRNFYAFGARQLYNSKGLCTSSIYASTQFLLNIINQEHPDYLVAATDLGRSTFRSEIYPEYKATRSEMPEELSVQIPYIFKLLELLNIPVLKKEGYEADDIIGSLVTQYQDKNLKKYILSSDKDFMQLVNDNTFLYIHKKDAPKVIIDSKAVLEKFGCYPDQIIDYLSMVGDSVDNVPGISGIGKKGATKLLEQFGSLDNIYNNLDSLPNNKLKNSLISGKDSAYLSKKLVIIKTDLDLGYTLEDFKVSANLLNSKELKDFFLELEFKKFASLVQTKNQPSDSDTDTGTSTATTNQEPSSVYNFPAQPTTSNLDTSSLKEAPTKTLFDSISALKEALGKHFSFHMVQTDEDLNSFKKELSSCEDISFFSFNYEKKLNKNNPYFISGISFSFRNKQDLSSYYFPLQELKDTNLGTSCIDLIKNILESYSIKKRTYNLKEAIKYLSSFNINPQGNIYDVMLMEYLSDSNIKDFSLEAMIQRSFSSIHLDRIDRWLKEGSLNLEDISLYYCIRSFYIYKLASRFIMELAQNSSCIELLKKIDTPFSRVLAGMELTGVYIDSSQLEDLRVYIEEQLQDLESRIYREAGEEFNINSPSQVQYIIYEKLKIHELLGVTKLKKSQSGYSTDISNLELLEDHPIPGLILEYRKLTTLLTTYLTPLPQLINPDTGRVHTHFNQVGTATGRISSYEPNLQNIPTRTKLGKKIRAAFCVSDPSKYILAADYSQIELRLLAHFSQDPALVQAFLQKQDIHTATATRIFNTTFDKVTPEQRAGAKTINFGIIYGMGSQRLAKSLGISVKEASEFLKLYFKMYPKIKDCLDSLVAEAQKTGIAKTLLGRPRPVPELSSPRPIVQSSGKHIAMNSPLQGTASDLIKIAMINIYEEFNKLGLKSKMILQIHDELVFEVDESELDQVKQIVTDKMGSALKLIVPLVVDIGVAKNWADAH